MKTNLLKVCELTGAALDWAVAKCEGGHIGVANNGVFFDAHDGDGFTSFEPSTDWAQGGPIIEREKIALRPTFTQGGYRTSASTDAVHAKIELPNGATEFDPEKSVWEYGPTPLIAAMRCYVASKLGDDVDVPEELK